MNNEELEHLRHSCAHLLAAAVLELYPGAKRTIGPAIATGFYYDFDLGDQKLSDADLSAIEKKMSSIVQTWKQFERREVSAKEAKEAFANNEYKQELIDEFSGEGQKLTLYTSGKYVDLCRGGHAESPSKELRHFKLLSIAGAYWRGDEKNKMLTRIYGTCFPTQAELDEYLKQLEEAKKRDHRKLGKELGIFAYDDDVGPGLPLWLPSGGAMIEALEELAKECEFDGGYERVKTPHIAKESMYLLSGHLPYYKDSMFPPMEYEGGRYYLKAMNCPHHHKIFAAEPKSYKDLPLRLAEYGTCYRHEKSGELFGLMRVRSMQMNDAHIYCTEEQFADEFQKVIDMYLRYFKIFSIDKYVMRLSKHSKENLGKKYVDEPELWIKTEEMVRRCLVNSKVEFVEVENEAAFYGPKIDVQIWSAIGREFTLATNQVDFAVPARFGLTYTDRDGQKKTPLCIHRAPLSTHERMIGFLIEHYGGNFPLWISPKQVAVIPVKDTNIAKADETHRFLRSLSIRSVGTLSGDGFGKKIREAKNLRIPYTIIIGDKDMEAGKVTLESRDKGSLGQLSIEEVAARLQKEIGERI